MNAAIQSYDILLNMGQPIDATTEASDYAPRYRPIQMKRRSKSVYVVTKVIGSNMVRNILMMFIMTPLLLLYRSLRNSMKYLTNMVIFKRILKYSHGKSSRQLFLVRS